MVLEKGITKKLDETGKPCVRENNGEVAQGLFGRVSLLTGIRRFISAAILLLGNTVAFGTEKGGYLFAHMTPSDYGRLYYSISRDGLIWNTLNSGKVILPEYKGHPDIIRGEDGQWHMIGVVFEKNAPVPYPVHWHTKDLIMWSKEELPNAIMTVSHLGLQNDGGWFGAPKTCYDGQTKQYVITWHAYRPSTRNNTELWESMRTVYITTKDFQTFAPAKRLFAFSGADEQMATIDTILRCVNGVYYAIIKDERWPETIATGKTIRIAKSKGGVLGPYTNPGAPICSSWHEAPILTVSPEGKYRIYTEAYTKGGKYDLFVADDMDGKWERKEYVSPKSRHGCIVEIDEAIYQKLLDTFGK